MIEIKQVENRWRIKEGQKNHYFRDIDKVYLHMLKGKMNEHGVISCTDLYVYVEDHNPAYDRHIATIKTAATHLSLVVPNGEFYNSMYTAKDKVFGNNY